MENMEATAAEQVRTFTQEELNAIVEDRVARERKKYADYEDLKAKAGKFTELEENQKSELQKQLESLTKADEVRKVREKVSQETGVPAVLLNADNEEACASQAQAILSFAKASNDT